MLILSRFFYFLYRANNSLFFLGLKNFLTIFIFSEFSRKKYLNIDLFNNKFYFRPRIDRGSYIRLTKAQYIMKGSINQPLEIIIDAGSNIGSQAIRLINLNPKLKKIICIEPDTENSNLCRKNLKNYNAITYNNALSNISNEILTIQKTINSEMSEIIEKSDGIIQSNNVQKIKTISLDDIIKNEKLSKIDFLKLDINGYEDELFEKNTEWLKITNSIGFNNADINKTTNKIIEKYKNSVGNIKIYNIDQMIFLMRENLDWLPIKGFMSSKNIGYVEVDQRY
jgi:FkbM family methyltransferase